MSSSSCLPQRQSERTKTTILAVVLYNSKRLAAQLEYPSHTVNTAIPTEGKQHSLLTGGSVIPRSSNILPALSRHPSQCRFIIIRGRSRSQ